MSYAVINSQYANLNGIAGYGAGVYAGGLHTNSSVEQAKTAIANGYEVNAAAGSYANKSQTSSQSYTQQTQAIDNLLLQGRVDDAMKKYDELYTDMATNSAYQGYNDNEIKTILQEKFKDSVNTTLVADINTNANSAYATAAAGAIPIVGLMCEANSSDDFIAKATNTPVSGWSKLKSAAGVATTATVAGTAGATVATLVKAAKSNGGFVDSMKNLFSSKANFKSGTGKAAVITGLVVAGASILTYLGGQFMKKEKP